MTEKQLPHRVTRRTALQSIGTVAGGSLVAPELVRARTAEPESYVGITYDTLTHRVQSGARAEISRRDDGIEGNLAIGGFEVPVGEETALAPTDSTQLPDYRLVQSEKSVSEDGLPLKLRFTTTPHCVVGTATRPSGDFGTLGFTLVASEDVPELGTAREIESHVEKGLLNEGNGIAPEGFESIPSVRSTGIPKNTGFRNVVNRGGEE